MLCGLPISITTSNFHEIASALKPFYAELQNPSGHQALHAILAPYTRKCAAMSKQPLPPGMPPPAEPLMDSIGILDRYSEGKYKHRAFKITDFWVGSVVLNRQPLFYV